MYLADERRGRVEGRKHLESIVNDFRDLIEHEKLPRDVKDYWYEPTTNTVHVTGVDDTLDDEEPIGDAVDSLDGDVQELQREIRL